jgi:hypothetical protein
MGLTMSLDKINKHGKYRQHVSTRNYFLAEKWGMPHNVLPPGEEADFEALNCLPALNLIRSTKLHLTTEPAFLPNACYMRFFFLH